MQDRLGDPLMCPHPSKHWSILPIGPLSAPLPRTATMRILAGIATICTSCRML